MVLRWSDGSYLEDQDMFRLSGIHRDVYLIATPKVRLRDIHLTSVISESLDKAELQVKGLYVIMARRQKKPRFESLY
mgnify:CR=1 FL=1